MASFFDRPAMDQPTTMDLCNDMSGSMDRVTTKYRRQMLAYRARMFLLGCLAWAVIGIFFIGLWTVFGVGK